MTAKPGTAFDPMEIAPQVRNPYPPPHDRVLDGRSRRPLGDPRGLTKFGVNLTELAPGAVSALRHWHTAEDEFVYVLKGEPTLVTDAGEETLRPGLCACFPANSGDGHRLENRSDSVVRYLEVGNRSDGEEVRYPDAGMVMEKAADGTRSFRRTDGSPW